MAICWRDRTLELLAEHSAVPMYGAIFRVSAGKYLALTITSLSIWSVSAYWAFIHHTLIPGVILVCFIWPCVLFVSLFVKRRLLNSRHLQVQEMLGGSSPPANH